MSAWIVEREHIAVLVNGLSQFGVEPGGTPQTVGQRLWAECHASVNYRYDENTPTPGYRHETAAEPLHVIAVLAAVDCYEHQSCEHPGWRDSWARRVTVDALPEAIFRAYPALGELVPDEYSPERMVHAYHRHPLRALMPWGFDELAGAYASRYALDERTP